MMDTGTAALVNMKGRMSSRNSHSGPRIPKTMNPAAIPNSLRTDKTPVMESFFQAFAKKV